MESTTKVVRPASGRRECLQDDEALALLSGGSVDAGAARLLSHVEECSACRRLVGAAASERVAGAGQRRADSTLAPGDRLGDRFEILGLLARGGMGEVYEARDHLLGEVVALKTIVLSALDNQRALSALKAEVQLARKVSHRNVCRILEFGVHTAGSVGARDKVPFFTMELLRGETLRGRLRRTATLELTEALPIVLQVIEGLAAIHGAGIVHRDLKPENVFLLEERQGLRALVMDFGLARPLELPESLASSRLDEGHGDRPAGTLEYMSPEQLRGAQPTPAFDVYALGTIMFEMLAGSRPFGRGRAGSWAATLERLESPAPGLSSVVEGADPRWGRVIERCLARSPHDRYGSIAEVREALLAPLPPREQRRPRAPPWRWALALSGVLAAALVGVVVSPWRTAPLTPAPAPVAAAPVPVAPVAPPAPREAAALSPDRRRDEPASVPRRSPRTASRRSGGAALASRATSVPGTPASTGSEDVSVLLERAEELLVAGEGAEACGLGERAAHQAPALPAVHRFLGKCYMRLPDARKARGHYLRYLELAPDAPDRLFVRAMVGQGQ